MPRKTKEDLELENHALRVELQKLQDKPRQDAADLVDAIKARDDEITALKARCFEILQANNKIPGVANVSCFDPDDTTPLGLSDRDVRVRISDRVTRFGMTGEGLRSQITSRFIDADGPRGGTRDEVWAIMTDADGVEHGVKVTVHTGPTIDDAAENLLRRPAAVRRAVRRR